MTAIILRADQTRAVLAAEKSIANGKNPLIVMPTGIGKTTVFVELVRRHLLARGDRRALILADMKELVDQAVKRFAAQANMLASVEMAERVSDDGSRVVVGTIQTVIARPGRWREDEFSLIVIDEAHMSEGASYAEVCQRFPRARVVGFTATPERPDGKGLKLFDEIAYAMTLSQALAEGLLAEPVIETIRLEAWTQADQGKRGNVAGVRDYKDEALENSFLEKGVAVPVAHAIAEKRKGQRCVAYLPGVKASKRLAEALVALGERAAHLDGETSNHERKRLLDAFRTGEIQILTNCNLLVKGYDDPEIGCIAMVRPTFNKTAYIQCVGRGLRLTTTKSQCLVLDFTLSGEVDTTLDARAALLGKTHSAFLELENEKSNGPMPELPPPDVRFPWANTADAAAFAFTFTSQRKIFFRGKFVSSDTLVALTSSPQAPQEREDRTFEAWAARVQFQFGERAKFGLSEAQASLLKRLVPGLRDPMVWGRSPVSARTVDEAITLQKKRETAGLSSLATSWTLFRFGFRPNLPKGVAKDLVEAIFETDGESKTKITKAQLEENLQRASRAFGTMELEARGLLLEANHTKDELQQLISEGI